MLSDTLYTRRLRYRPCRGGYSQGTNRRGGAVWVELSTPRCTFISMSGSVYVPVSICLCLCLCPYLHVTCHLCPCIPLCLYLYPIRSCIFMSMCITVSTYIFSTLSALADEETEAQRCHATPPRPLDRVPRCRAAPDRRCLPSAAVQRSSLACGCVPKPWAWFTPGGLSVTPVGWMTARRHGRALCCGECKQLQPSGEPFGTIQ